MAQAPGGTQGVKAGRAADTVTPLSQLPSMPRFLFSTLRAAVRRRLAGKLARVDLAAPGARGGHFAPLPLMAFCGAVFCGAAILFSSPRAWPLADAGLGLSAAAALVAWIAHRRLVDALVLALPPLAGPWVDPELGAQALSVASLAIYLLTRRPRFAAVAGSVGVALLLAAVRLKLRFAGTPLTWQDIGFFFRQFDDNVGVLATQPTLLWSAGSALVLAFAGCAVAWRWNPPGRAVGRTAPIAAAALTALLVAHGAGLVVEGVSRLGASGAWFVADGLVERPLFAFFATASLQPRWEVPATDTAAFRQGSQGLMSAGDGSRPADIVVILQESQFNPQTIEGCASAACRTSGQITKTVSSPAQKSY